MVRLLQRLALVGTSSAFSAADAMRFALARQNPLIALALPRRQAAPAAETSGSLVSLDKDNAVVVAFKPAEEIGRGIVLRVWELAGRATRAAIGVSAMGSEKAFETSLIETDVQPLARQGPAFLADIPANAIMTYRFLPPPRSIEER